MATVAFPLTTTVVSLTRSVCVGGDGTNEKESDDVRLLFWNMIIIREILRPSLRDDGVAIIKFTP